MGTAYCFATMPLTTAGGAGMAPRRVATPEQPTGTGTGRVFSRSAGEEQVLHSQNSLTDGTDDSAQLF